MIFTGKRGISGLTTAAGIWATAGIGMAIGSGMYIIGGFSCILVIVTQIFLHRDFGWLRIPVAEKICVKMKRSDEAIDYIKERCVKNHIGILSLKESRTDEFSNFEIYAKIRANYDLIKVVKSFYESKDVSNIEIFKDVDSIDFKKEDSLLMESVSIPKQNNE